LSVLESERRKWEKKKEWKRRARSFERMKGANGKR